MAQKIKLLIAIDGSESAMDAVRYASHFYNPKRTAIALIHIMADFPEAVEDLKNISSFDSSAIATHSWHGHMLESVQIIMQEAENVLIGSGYDKKAIEIKIRKRRNGVAKDIIDESENGYDAIFIGRRGTNNPNDIIVGATAYRMMSGINHLPVVVVGDKPDPNHVLIGFDGSENAFKAIDCACAMMPRTGRKIVLCHVARSLNIQIDDRKVFTEKQEKEWIEKSRKKIADLMEKAEKQLLDAGFESGLIVREVCEGKVSRAVSIAKIAEYNNCGTIVIGRRGLSVIKDFLMGRVTMKVLHKAHEMAVWIV